MTGDELAPCGTVAAYRRHLRHGEEPCAECRAANTAAVRAFRSRTPVAPRELLPCGTEAAWRRHYRRRERACPECSAAHAATVRRWRRRGAA